MEKSPGVGLFQLFVNVYVIYLEIFCLTLLEVTW